MEIVVLLLIVAVFVGAAWWNKRNSALAREGVEFAVDAVPAVVARSVHDVYCGGVKAATKSLLSGVTVTDAGNGTFRVLSRLGDQAVIEVIPNATGSTVRARTTQLYVGTPPALHGKGGLYGLSSVIMHRIYVAIGISPYAARMKRLQQGVEDRVHKGLRRMAQQ
jgi:hypothetical protein